MEKFNMFIKILKEEVNVIGDPRFTFENMELGKGDSARFHFKLGKLSEDFSIRINFLETADAVMMMNNAAKLADKAYKYLIGKTQYDRKHILRKLVDIIKDVVEKSPINGFEVTGVEYFQTTAKVNFKIFGFDEHYEIDLGVMDTFDTTRLYASYVVSRVISNGADDMIYEAKK